MTTFKRILCPVDFSDVSQHALEHALAIANWYKASVSVYRTSRCQRPFCTVDLMAPSAFDSAERGEVCQDSRSLLFLSLDCSEWF